MAKFNQKNIVKLGSDKYQKAVADQLVGEQKQNPFNLLGSNLFRVPNGSVAPTTAQDGPLGTPSGGLTARGREGAPMLTDLQQRQAKGYGQTGAPAYVGVGLNAPFNPPVNPNNNVYNAGVNSDYQPTPQKYLYGRGATEGQMQAGYASGEALTPPPPSPLNIALEKIGLPPMNTNLFGNLAKNFGVQTQTNPKMTTTTNPNSPAGEKWFSTENLVQEAAYAITQGYIPPRIEPRVAASLKANGIDVSSMYDVGGNLVNPQGGISQSSNYVQPGLKGDKWKYVQGEGTTFDRNRGGGRRRGSGSAGFAAQEQIASSPTSFGLVNWNVKFG